MVRFIELNGPDDKPFLISQAVITGICPNVHGGCNVEYGDGILSVKQSYEAIYDAIKNASPETPIITVKE